MHLRDIPDRKEGPLAEFSLFPPPDYSLKVEQITQTMLHKSESFEWQEWHLRGTQGLLGSLECCVSWWHNGYTSMFTLGQFIQLHE